MAQYDALPTDFSRSFTIFQSIQVQENYTTFFFAMKGVSEVCEMT